MKREENEKEKSHFRATFLFGGQGWIRTIEVTDGRFTVCSLWPLGNLPIFSFAIGGAGGRTRTPDLLITNQLLYQLSYTSVSTLDYYTTKKRTRQPFFDKFLKFFCGQRKLRCGIYSRIYNINIL